MLACVIKPRGGCATGNQTPTNSSAEAIDQRIRARGLEPV
jgi:hypothetical protein